MRKNHEDIVGKKFGMLTPIARGPDRYKSGTHTENEIIDSNYLRDLRKKIISYNGETHDICEWAKIKGLTYSTINWRLKNGWTLEDTLETPMVKHRQRIIEIDGETHTINEWAKLNKIGITTIYERLSKGWSEQDAVTIPPRSGVKHNVNA